jgi:nucleotide-binding universal stress UspA family protein
VPLDGDDVSTRAVPTALALARATGAPLELVRVFDVPYALLTGRAGTLGVADAAAEARARAARELEALAASLGPAGVEATATVLDGTDVAGTLLAHAERRDAAMVVMTTAARGAFGRAVVGSVADAVMRAAGRPVVLVPPGGQAAEPPAAARPAADATGRWRVLVPLDGSPLSLGAVEYLLSAYDDLPVEVVLFRAVVPNTLLGVVPPEAMIDPAGLGDEEAAAREMLDAVAGRFAARGIPVRAEVARTSAPADAIVDAARAAGAHLVAMCTRGQGGLRRLAVGSAAAAVVRGAPVPVLLLAPH